MKTTRAGFGVVGFFTLAVFTALQAQTVDFLLIQKQHGYTQTDSSTVSENASAPWQFRASVEGTNLAGITAPTFTTPAGSLVNGGTMAYNAGDQQWITTADFNSLVALDASYANGQYTTTALGATADVNMVSNAFPNTPLATVSAGTWSGGVLWLNPSQALTITSNSFAGFASDHLNIEINGSGYNDSVESFSTDSLSLNVPAFSLVGGQSYTVSISFDKLLSFDQITGGPLNGATVVGLNTTWTSFTVQAVSAVPEPAVTVAMFGGLALVGAMALRRRKQAGVV